MMVSPVGQVLWLSSIGAALSGPGWAGPATSSTALASATHLSIPAPFLSHPHAASARSRRFLSLVPVAADGWWPADRGFVRPACMSAVVWVITRFRVITQTADPGTMGGGCRIIHF